MDAILTAVSGGREGQRQRVRDWVGRSMAGWGNEVGTEIKWKGDGPEDKGQDAKGSGGQEGGERRHIHSDKKQLVQEKPYL